MRTSSHHQPEAQHPKSPAIETPAGRLPHLWVMDRDRGEPRGSSPPTPPCIRVRTRRFGGLSGHLFPQEGWPPEFGSVHRRRRFGPCVTAPLGFTLQSWRAGRALPGVFCRMAPSRCAFLLLLPSVRAFSGSLRLICPLLTSAPWSGHLAAPSVPNSEHDADLPG